jgi:2Fe-2S ferredoxin
MKVKFMPQNIELEIKPDQSVKDLADKNGIFIKSICNGLPSCAECRIRVTEGEHNVLPPSAKELNLIGTGYFIDQRRLSCQLLCFGDITVDMAEQLEKQKQGPKRTQGSRKVEIAASHAVTGNLIEQDQDIKNIQAAPSAPRENRPPQEKRDNRDNKGQRGDNRGPRNDKRDQHHSRRDQRPRSAQNKNSSRS